MVCQRTWAKESKESRYKALQQYRNTLVVLICGLSEIQGQKWLIPAHCIPEKFFCIDLYSEMMEA